MGDTNPHNYYDGRGYYAPYALGASGAPNIFPYYGPGFYGRGPTAPIDPSISCRPLTPPTFTDISAADVTIIAASDGGDGVNSVKSGPYALAPPTPSLTGVGMRRAPFGAAYDSRGPSTKCRLKDHTCGATPTRATQIPTMILPATATSHAKITSTSDLAASATFIQLCHIS